MVHLTRTRSLTEAFEHAASCARCRKSATADATALFVDYCAKGSSNLIPHQVVVALSQCIRECAEWHGPVFVHQLTHDCEVVIDSKPPPPPTEEELKEKHKAQVRLQHAQYKRMTANVQHSKSSPNDPVQCAFHFDILDNLQRNWRRHDGIQYGNEPSRYNGNMLRCGLVSW